ARRSTRLLRGPPAASIASATRAPWRSETIPGLRTLPVTSTTTLPLAAVDAVASTGELASSLGRAGADVDCTELNGVTSLGCADTSHHTASAMNPMTTATTTTTWWAVTHAPPSRA